MPLAVFVPAQLNDLSVDVSLGTPAQGAVLYRGASVWNALAAGTSGQVLQSGGAGANPAWATLPADTDTFAALTDVTLTSAAQGDVYYRNAAGKVVNLGPGTAGQVLTTGGAAANPSWATAAAASVTPDLILTRAGAATPADPRYLTITPGADTALTASTEASDVLWSLNRTQQFATGALTNQRAVYIRKPTYGFVGASVVTNAATLAIEGAPVAGTNATLTNTQALWVQTGSDAAKGIVAQGNSGSQSGYLFEAQDNTGASVFGITQSGWLRLGVNSGGAILQQGSGGTANWLSAFSLQLSGSLVVGSTFQTPMINSGSAALTLGTGNNSLAYSVLIPSIAVGQSCLALQGIAGQTAALLGLQQVSSTSVLRDAGKVDAVWAVSTDATRQGRLTLTAAGFNGSASEGFRVEGDGLLANTKIGFYGVTAVARQTFAAAATDAATTQTLANSLRSALIALGLGQ